MGSTSAASASPTTFSDPAFAVYAILLGPALEEILMRGIVLRGLLFSGLFIVAAYYLRLTPDLSELLKVVRKRLHL